MSTVTETVNPDNVRFVTGTQENIRAAADAVIAERVAAGKKLVDASFLTTKEYVSDLTMTYRLLFEDA